MKTFGLRLCDATRTEDIPDVVTFIGEDASGSFGLLAGHAPFMTALVTGLARFRRSGGAWQYLALPGAIAYFHDDLLTVGTRRYLLDDDFERISGALRERLLAEEQTLRKTKRSLRTLEEEILKRLWELGREGLG